MELIKLHPVNPEKRLLSHIIEVLDNDGVIIYPTDTLYGFGCDITSHKAVERIARIKNIDPRKANFSFLIEDLAHVNDFAKPFSNIYFKLMKRNLPGPFTFILNANNSVPKMLKNNKKTVGIRVPDSIIAKEIVNALGKPLMTSSIPHEETDNYIYPSDPEEIFEEFKYKVDLVIDGGIGGIYHSTIVDCTGDEPVITRQGIGELIW
jgi:tRNA threonylcarbamoyl adenosine modification protein (Sua5/YciO/YrdC/YwlC family)